MACTAISCNMLVASGSGFLEEIREDEDEFFWEPDTYVEIWNAHTKKRVWLECYEAVCALDFSQDGTMLATGSTESKIKLWRLDSEGRCG